MTQGIHPLAANMVNQLNRVDIISNNIANTNTVGFKQDNVTEGSFNNYLQNMKDEKKDVSKLSYVINTVPKIDGDFINSKLGSISSTGNKLDFALNKADTFFKIKTPQGEINLTRNGEFKNLNGALVTQNGYPVLNNDNEPIQIEDELSVTSIAIVSSNFSNLSKIGDNNYKIKDTKEVLDVQNSQEYIIQGAIERSNTNPVKSMISLIDAQRRFEQAQKAIAGIDQLNSKVIDSIGNNK